MKNSARKLSTDARLRSTGAWLLLALGVSFAPAVNAGQGVWTSGGPDGGEVLALAIDPAHSGTLYAGTRGGGVFKSTNAGGSWAPINAGLPSATVRALAIDPSMPATLYAGTEGSGVFKSVNGGLSWRAVNSGLTDDYVDALAIDPSAPATLYAAAAGSVFKTTNGGEGWTFTFRNPNPADVVALTIDASAPSHIYAGAEEVDWPPHGGLFRSTDSGASWSNSLLNLDVYALVIDPSSPATLYAATYDGVYKSRNGGETWPAPSARLTSLTVPALAIDPSNPSILYAGTSGGVVFRSTDSGSTWTAVNNGLPDLSVLTLALDPTGSTLYAGLLGGGVWQLTAPKAGATWTALLPATAHSPGANEALYTTDLSVSNAGGSPASVTLKFLGNNRDGAAGREWIFFLDPGRSTTIRDVLGSVFNETSSFGALRIVSNSPALNLVSVTSTPGFGGTLGQTVPAVDVGDLIPAGSSRSILYVREGDGFRSNLVLASNASVATDVDVALVSPAGSTLATKSYSVPPSGMTQINRVVRDMGVSGQVTGARLLLSSRTPGAAFTGFASVIDETTNDPTTLPVLPASVSGSGPWIWLLPATARSHSAGGAFYTSNLAISNTGTAPASLTMKLLGHDQDGSAGPERTFNLDAGNSVTYFDVLGSIFGQTSNFGAIRITSDAPTLGVVSVTSTPAFGGTLSQTVPAVFSSDLIPAGTSRSILYIREGDGFRSNLVLASNADVSTTVDVALVSAEGATLATKGYAVPPNGMTQINRVVHDMGISGAITGARLVLSSSTPGASFTGLASVIDEVTNDPTTIEAK